MVIYRLSIVKRNLPVEHEQSKIIDFIEEINFYNKKTLASKLKKLYKKGLTIQDIDITVYDKDSNGEDYMATLDSVTLEDKGY